MLGKEKFHALGLGSIGQKAIENGNRIRILARQPLELLNLYICNKICPKFRLGNGGIDTTEKNVHGIVIYEVGLSVATKINNHMLLMNTKPDRTVFASQRFDTPVWCLHYHHFTFVMVKDIILQAWCINISHLARNRGHDSYLP